MKECRGEIFVINANTIPKKNFDPGILVTGIAIYEVLRVKEKTPLFLEDHIERLFYSAKVSGAKTLPSQNLIRENFILLIENNPDIQEGNIRLLLHFENIVRQKPDIYCYYIPHSYPSEKEYASGVPILLVNAERRKVHSKIINLEFRSFIAQRIKAENAYEALLINREGLITEGSKSNVFMIRKNRVVTPPEKYVLPGITRKYVLRICKESGIDAEESKIHCKEISDYESCFITGTSPGVLAVRNIGSTWFNREHELLLKLSGQYHLLVDNYIALNKPKFN